MSLLRAAVTALFLTAMPALALADAVLQPPAARMLLPFASPEGLARLTRAGAKADFAPLANQFEAQASVAFCGPTSAAIVLNAANSPRVTLPRDSSRLLPEDGSHLPKGLDLTVPRHTQESVIAKGAKTRAQVFGEPRTVDGKTLRDGGYQLRQLDQLLRAHGLATRLVVVDEVKAEAEIRQDLLRNLQQAGDFVIVNYRRSAVGQAGGGHMSPLAAYDAESDSVLVLDVNPSLQPWVWMPVATLIQGVRTKDVLENRGYILVQSAE